MSFKNRTDFITSSESEKLTLVHVHANKRLYTFSDEGDNIYSKRVPYFVYEVKQNDTKLVRLGSDVQLNIPGTFYYNPETGYLYVHLFDDELPTDVELIVTYRFFYSNNGVENTWNLQDLGDAVFYDGRVTSSPGYDHKIGIDQALTSLVGSGTLKLTCPDGDLDEIFDTLIFENQIVDVYSWNPDLDPSDAKKIYTGRITNKTFDTKDLTFTIKDQLYDLLASPNIDVYSDADQVSDSIKGQYKRLIYGRIDGLRGQSIDQIVNGFPLTGTVSAQIESNVLTGLGTNFLTELFQNDEITVGSQTFTIEAINSNTEAILNDEPEFSFSGMTALVTPVRGSINHNRNYLFAGHRCAKVTRIITKVNQLNRITLDSTEGMFTGDFIELVDTGERIQIRNVAPNNIIVLQQNMIVKPSLDTEVTRQPIQTVYIGNRIVPSDSFNITNDPTCNIELDSDIEFKLALNRNTVFDMNFTNGSRQVTYTDGGDVSLIDIFKPKDWIKPNDADYTTYYQISYIDGNTIYLTSNFSDITTTDDVDYKSPDYLTDDSIISCDILGMTEDGSESGEWIRTAAQVNRHLLNSIGVDNLNDDSFDDGAIEANQLISLAIPEDFSSSSLPNVKSILDDLNKSVNASLTLDNDLLIKFKVVNAFVKEDLKIINDFDVIGWNIKSTNGKIYNKVLATYRDTDTDLSTLEPGNKLVSFDSEFVNRYIGTGTTNQMNLKLYRALEAEIATHRNAYYNRLSVATLTLTSDLRLETMELGECVIVDFQRLYKRFGDHASRKKVMLVVGKTVTGHTIKFELSDLGNTFNTSSYITPNDAPEWTDATELDKLVYGYITDNQGIVNDEENTDNTHLIS